MTREQLNNYKKKINSLSDQEKKLRDLYLRKIATGEYQGPQTEYSTINKPWLKWESEGSIKLGYESTNICDYFFKMANKEDVLIEAGDNDITIETTFKPYIEEFAEDEEAELIASSIKSGRCVKTIRFENSLDLENIKAKFANGIVIITVPKLIIPKHKVNVE